MYVLESIYWCHKKDVNIHDQTQLRLFLSALSPPTYSAWISKDWILPCLYPVTTHCLYYIEVYPAISNFNSNWIICCPRFSFSYFFLIIRLVWHWYWIYIFFIYTCGAHTTFIHGYKKKIQNIISKTLKLLLMSGSKILFWLNLF